MKRYGGWRKRIDFENLSCQVNTRVDQSILDNTAAVIKEEK